MSHQWNVSWSHLTPAGIDTNPWGRQQTSRSPATCTPSSWGARNTGTAQPASPRPSPVHRTAAFCAVPRQGRLQLLALKHDPALPSCQSGHNEFGSELVPVLTVWGLLRAQDPDTEALGALGPARAPPVTLQTRQRAPRRPLCWARDPTPAQASPCADPAGGRGV